jgi:hypothetical protein
MFYVLQNESTAALRRVPILLTDAATGTTAQTGVATTTIFPYVNINGNAFIGGTGNVGEAGYGQYYYEFEVNEIATLGLAGIHITAAGCRDYDAITQVAAFNLYGAAGAGISAGDVWEYDISAISTAGTAGSQLNLAASGSGASTYSIAEEVWNFDITGYTNGAGGYITNINGNVNDAKSNTNNIALQVWGDDLGAGANSPYAAGTAGTILYTLGQAGVALTAGDIWEYDISAISTAGTAGSQLNLAASPSGAGLSAYDVWNYTLLSSASTADLTIGNIDSNVTTIQGNTSNIAGTVWDAATVSYTTNGSFGLGVLRSDNASVAGNVTLWNGAAINGVYSDVYRIDEDYNAAIALKDILTGIGSSITGNITGDLSGSVGSVTADVNVSTASMTGIAGTVWSTDISGYTSPSAGYSLYNATGGVAVTAGDIWSYATREITGGIADTVTTVSGNVLGSVLFIVDDVTLSAGTQASIANSVWSTDVSGYTSPSAGYDLTQASAGGGGITAGDVWNYDLSSYTPLGISAGSYLFFNTDTIFNNLDIASSSIGSSVWSYAGRTITGGIADTVTTLTNRSGFAITGGTITTVSDKTGYSLSGTQAFNLTGNITGNLSGSVGSVSGNVGGNVVGSVASVTNPVTFVNTQYAAIASSVWNAGTRTLTAGGGITAGDVWTYNISGISASGSAGNALNDAAVSGSVVSIVNGPYRLTSIAEGVDGRIDILQGSIQTINLNCQDGTGQPFNVTGYTIAVDVYDIASTSVATYTPTVNYAGGGNISFDIDGDVTDVIGTYNIVVSLTDGDIVQLGPLQILVRPL